jgi:hypothetical protein
MREELAFTLKHNQKSAFRDSVIKLQVDVEEERTKKVDFQFVYSWAIMVSPHLIWSF